ncbi:MAG: hypothetical protein RLW62_24090 [Gammaproteobacteria bacterium]
MRNSPAWLLVTVATATLSCSAVHADTVLAIADTFESGDPFDFVPAGGTVESVSGGALDGTVLAFNSAGNTVVFGYDAIRYPLDVDALFPRRVTLGFDLQTSALAGSTSQFSVLFDAPAVRSLVFDARGDIAIYNPAAGAAVTVGSYADASALHIEMTLDTVADRWTVTRDGATLHDGSANGTTIGSVRFFIGALTSAVPPSPLATVFLDNVTLHAEDFVALPDAPVPVPLPSAPWALAAGVALLARVRRR